MSARQQPVESTFKSCTNVLVVCATLGQLDQFGALALGVTKQALHVA